MFTILWSTLPGIREYPGNFQNETEQEVAYPLEKQEFTPKNKTKKKVLLLGVPSKVRGKVFLKWTRSIDLSSKLSLTYI